MKFIFPAHSLRQAQTDSVQGHTELVEVCGEGTFIETESLVMKLHSFN